MLELERKLTKHTMGKGATFDLSPHTHIVISFLIITKQQWIPDASCSYYSYSILLVIIISLLNATSHNAGVGVLVLLTFIEPQ